MLWVLRILRIFLGVIFVYAAWTKLQHPWTMFALSIDAYQLLPEWAVLAIARTLPGLELVIGILLLTGFALRYVALAAALILAMFFSIMLFSWGKGMAIDCGCFGLGDALTWKSLVRDGALLVSAMILAWSAFRVQRRLGSRLFWF